ncbi:MAG: hypothetical protein ACO1SV_21065 [Fimbriimonas sp.]
MKSHKRKLWVLAGLTAMGALSLAYKPQEPGEDQGVGVPGVTASGSRGRSARRAYEEAIRKTAAMAQDPTAQRLAQQHDLNVLSLTWEDTGRFKGSSVGPNISDMTIQVLENGRARCMPVIRFPNFSDKTCDLDPADFTVLVGNHRSAPLRRVSLRDLLDEPTRYLTRPSSWRGGDRSLLAPRDSKVLVSAQACFLPVPQQGKATFNPVLFNYQSVKGDPAVLTILATREGTSMTIIDNTRDAFSEGAAWGQRLFHNSAGQRASLTGQRISDFNAAGGDRTGGPAKGAGLSMVMLIQVPLKQKQISRFQNGYGGGGFGGPPAAAAMESTKSAGRGRSDVEAAVIGHGDLEGPFTEIDNLAIERDDRFPVRVTVQFYKATSNGVVNAGDMSAIKSEVDRVYAESDSVGSLVTEGRTGRVTEYDGVKVQSPDWWREFWRRHQQNTGDSPEVARRKLAQLLGKEYLHRPVSELYLRDLLRR